MKFFISFLCFSFFVITCFSCSVGSIELSEKERLSNDMKAKTAEELEKKHGIQTIGMGGSSYDKIRMLHLSFQIKEPLKKDFARELLVDCVYHLLKNINEDETIRPFLITYPFTETNVEIAIFSVDCEGAKVYHPFLTIADIADGKINYCTKSPENRYQYKTKESETFAEAVEILKRQGKLK